MNPPMFEGRPLARPHEEIVDQGLGFDLATLLSRRRALGLMGVAGAGLALTAATASPAAALGHMTEIPDETAGPYPGRGAFGPNILRQSGIVRRDIRSSFGRCAGTAEGVLMTLELKVWDLTAGERPFAGVAVYVWHCDRAGGYSMYSLGLWGQNYLRGVQITDASGLVRFTSIFPACYPERWPHIHFEVYPDQARITDPRNAIATSQIALPEAASAAVYTQPGYEQSVIEFGKASLDTDYYFRDDGGIHQLTTATGDVGSGYTVRLEFGIDTKTPPNPPDNDPCILPPPFPCGSPTTG
jgi:protocatechuate 3,4-dioxygenase beta subunit